MASANAWTDQRSTTPSARRPQAPLSRHSVVPTPSGWTWPNPWPATSAMGKVWPATSQVHGLVWDLTFLFGGTEEGAHDGGAGLGGGGAEHLLRHTRLGLGLSLGRCRRGRGRRLGFGGHPGGQQFVGRLPVHRVGVL